MAIYWKLKHKETGLYLFKLPCPCEKNINVKSYISKDGIKFSKKINKEIYFNDTRLDHNQFYWEINNEEI